MISKEDSFYTYEYKKYFKILPSFNNLYKDKNYIKNGKKFLQILNIIQN